MISLDIKYSIKSEISRVQDAVNRIDWFKEKGYRIRLPEALSASDYNHNDQNIERAVESEYNKKNYEREERYILNTLSKIKDVLGRYFMSVSLNPKDIYKIYLTRYGVGGSYFLPNSIIVNIQVRKEMKLIKTIVHEVIHLSIEELIQKYNIDHWSKERLVDLLLKEIDPEINIIQKITVDTKNVDKAFEKEYPNIEKIIKSI